jgi:hypothetical protein
VPLNRSALEILHNSEQPAAIRATAASANVLLDQYKLYVEMADRISSRRQTTNSFFLALNSAIISIGGYTAVKEGPAVPLGLIVLTAVAGVMISALWLRLILSYRDLNSAKFEVIHAIEKLLPVSPYDAEWQAVERGKSGWLYLPFSHIELWVPVGFAAIHLLGAAVVIGARP